MELLVPRAHHLYWPGHQRGARKSGGRERSSQFFSSSASRPLLKLLKSGRTQHRHVSSARGARPQSPDYSSSAWSVTRFLTCPWARTPLSSACGHHALSGQHQPEGHVPVHQLDGERAEHRRRSPYFSTTLLCLVGSVIVVGVLTLSALVLQGGEVVPTLTIHDTIKHIRSDVGTVAFGGAMAMAGFLLAIGTKVHNMRLSRRHISLPPPPQRRFSSVLTLNILADCRRGSDAACPTPRSCSTSPPAPPAARCA